MSGLHGFEVPTFGDFLETLENQPTSEGELAGRWGQYDQHVHLLVRQTLDNPDFPGSPAVLTDILAEAVITRFLGPDWYAANVLRKTRPAQAASYLDTQSTNRMMRLLSLHRTYEVARRLFELQSFPWFDDAVSKLKTSNLSGASFELDVLQMVQVLGVGANIRVEVQDGRKNHDADMHLGDLHVPIEVKAKDDTTPFTPQTVVSTLKKAKGQLPIGSQGIIFFRLPTAWVGPRLEEELLDAVADATRSTSRVGAVVCAVDQPHLNPGQDRYGSVSRRLMPIPMGGCNERIFDFVMRLRTFWEQDLKGLAPVAPF